MKSLIIGKCDTYITDFLGDLSYSIEYSSENSYVDSRLKNHADISLLRVDEQTFVIESSQKDIIQKLRALHFDVFEIKFEEHSVYPNDCRLNFAIFDDYIYGSSKALTNGLISVLNNKRIKFVHVNQGYAKCSTIILNKRAAITDDVTLYNSMKSHRIDVLLLSKGFVKLNGFDYGFIGGASFVDDEERRLVFFGDISKHSDYEKIRWFAEKHKYTIEYIKNKPLTDIGGAIII